MGRPPTDPSGAKIRVPLDLPPRHAQALRHRLAGKDISLSRWLMDSIEQWPEYRDLAHANPQETPS